MFRAGAVFFLATLACATCTKGQSLTRELKAIAARYSMQEELSSSDVDEIFFLSEEAAAPIYRGESNRSELEQVANLLGDEDPLISFAAFAAIRDLIAPHNHKEPKAGIDKAAMLKANEVLVGEVLKTPKARRRMGHFASWLDTALVYMESSPGNKGSVDFLFLGSHIEKLYDTTQVITAEELDASTCEYDFVLRNAIWLMYLSGRDDLLARLSEASAEPDELVRVFQEWRRWYWRNVLFLTRCSANPHRICACPIKAISREIAEVQMLMNPLLSYDPPLSPFPCIPQPSGPFPEPLLE